MQNYVAILRGINVSGQKMIKMDALRTMISAANFHNVRTYIQSGNVIFEAAETQTDILASQISELIFKKFGFEVPVLVLTLAEMLAIIDKNPFSAAHAEDSKYLHVTFLAEVPDPANIAKIDPDKYLPDTFAVIEKATYLYCPNGYGNTKLHNAFLENKLKVAATTRNWKTVGELLAMMH